MFETFFIDYTFLTMFLGTVCIVATAWLLRARIGHKSAKYYKDEIEYWKENANTWRKRFNATNKSLVQLEGDYQVTDEGDAGLAMGALVDAVLPVLPEGARKFLKGKPELLSMAVNFATKNPELVNGLLSKLTRTANSPKGSTSSIQEEGKDWA